MTQSFRKLDEQKKLLANLMIYTDRILHNLSQSKTVQEYLNEFRKEASYL